MKRRRSGTNEVGEYEVSVTSELHTPAERTKKQKREEQAASSGGSEKNKNPEPDDGCNGAEARGQRTPPRRRARRLDPACASRRAAGRVGVEAGVHTLCTHTVVEVRHAGLVELFMEEGNCIHLDRVVAFTVAVP